MRALLLCLLLWALPVHGWAALSVVGTVGEIGNAVSSVTTATLDTTGANLIVCTGMQGLSSFAATPISDSKGNTWTSAVTLGTTGITYYAKNATVGSGHTFTLTLTGSGYPSIACSAVADADTTAPLDQTNTGDDGGPVTTHTTGSVSTTQADEILFGGMDCAASTEVATAGPSYTMTYSQPGSGTNTSIHHEHRIVASTGSYTASWTTVGSVWCGEMITTYKASTGGPAYLPFSRRLQAQ